MLVNTKYIMMNEESRSKDPVYCEPWINFNWDYMRATMKYRKISPLNGDRVHHYCWFTDCWRFYRAVLPSSEGCASKRPSYCAASFFFTGHLGNLTWNPKKKVLRHDWWSLRMRKFCFSEDIICFSGDVIWFVSETNRSERSLNQQSVVDSFVIHDSFPRQSSSLDFFLRLSVSITTIGTFNLPYRRRNLDVGHFFSWRLSLKLMEYRYACHWRKSFAWLIWASKPS